MILVLSYECVTASSIMEVLNATKPNKSVKSAWSIEHAVDGTIFCLTTVERRIAIDSNQNIDDM